MNVQPVIPFSISEEWNLITRTIFPVVVQDDVVGTSSQGGLSDTTFSTWFSPKAPTSNGWIWGVGPAFLLPTGTDDLLTANQWAAGPTAIALKQQGKFTYGALVNQLWSYAGDGGRGPSIRYFSSPSSPTFPAAAGPTQSTRKAPMTIPAASGRFRSI
jgi:hypothetical protein